MQAYLADLSTLISMRSVAGNKSENVNIISFLTQKLEDVGFCVKVEGNSRHGQPVIIARLGMTGSDASKVLLYNHYDVEPSHCENWESDPFILSEREGRLYGRGVADNKAALLARIYAIQAVQKQGGKLPEIMWVIQGEEEVGSEVAHHIFPKYMPSFNADLFLEETGYYKGGIPYMFVVCQEPYQTVHMKRINACNSLLFQGEALYEYRHLNKFGDCPFLKNIPNRACYLAFGPNDEKASIHKENESISKSLLGLYKQNFKTFLTWV